MAIKKDESTVPKVGVPSTSVHKTYTDVIPDPLFGDTTVVADSCIIYTDGACWPNPGYNGSVLTSMCSVEHHGHL